jgi:gliding motility-associated protein GldE
MTTDPLPQWQYLLSVADIMLIIGIVILFFMSALATLFYRAIESINRSDYSEIKGMGTTSSSLVVNLLDNESTTTTALEFAALMFRGFSLLMGLLLFENLVPSHIGGYYLIMACMAVIYLLLFALLTIRLPHSMAHKNDVGIVCRWALMIKIMVAIFTPFAYIINKLVNNRTANSNSNALSGDEISDMIEIAEGGDDVETETKMLKGIVRFSDLVVSEIMKSRVDVVAIEKNTSVSNIVDIAKETGFSRIPVYENTIDNIKGILYIKDLLPLMNSDTTEWNNLIRPAFFIPETKSVSDLLHEFQEDKIHVAIVVDEYGGTSGLVTLEDIIEEIVGEITDEYDKAETTYNQISDNTFLFNAKTSIIDFCKIMGLSDETFDDMRGDSETLAGLILEVVGEIPAEKENVSISNFDFLIVKADNRRIEQVQVTLKQE